MANAERLDQGLEAPSGDAPPQLEVVLALQGGQVLGRAVTADPKVVASGAAIALIPDPPVGRVQAYQTTQADEYGNFYLQGLPPGKYLLVGWLDQPPCDVYNPDDFAACQAEGAAITISEGEERSAQVDSQLTGCCHYPGMLRPWPPLKLLRSLADRSVQCRTESTNWLKPTR